MKRIFSFLFIFFLILGSSYAQEDVKIRRKDFKVKKVGFREAWKDVKAGDDYFEEGIGTYAKALDHYLRAYKYNNNNAALNYKIGVSMLGTNQFYKAVDFLEKAYLSEAEVASDILYMLARAYHLNTRFDKAIEYYRSFYEELSSKEKEDLRINIDKLIGECRNGKRIVMEPVRVVIENMGGRINSEYDDYNPVLHPDGELLYFTSRRPTEKNKEKFELDNKYYEEILVAERAGELWKLAKPVGKKLNEKSNQSVLAFSDDGKHIYIYDGDDGDILVSEYKKGKWRSLKKPPGKLLSKDMETSFTISSDGRDAYFISEREGGLGGKDIYFSTKSPKGKWTEPRNLGSVINTRYDEEGVYLDPEGMKLYFSSEGHNSMGGYDIFVSERDGEGNWKDPVNIGYPVNTPADDIFYRPFENEKEAYFSSTRDNGIGGKDIFRVFFLGEEKELLLDNENKLLAWSEHPDYEMFYKMPSGVEVDTAIYLIGKVRDSKSEEPVIAKIEVIDTDESKIIATAISDGDGSYKIKLPEQKDYGVELTAKDYLFYVKMLYLSEKKVEDGQIQHDFKLDKVEVGSKMILNNIFFETNSSSLKSESYEELERVVRLLKDNPSIRLEISGHTDNVGGYRANLRLSEARAKSVVEYLISKGIDKKRLEYKGYSFTQPVADNNTEEGRSKNRRVEFKVLSK